MTILLLVSTLVATADEPASLLPTAEPRIAVPVDTSWVARLRGRYRVTLLGAEGSDSAGIFEIVFGPVSRPVEDARMPHIDRVTDERGEYVETLEPPVTLTLPLASPYTRHCVAARVSTEEGERALRCPLTSRVGPGLHAWFDRERLEDVDRMSPHMGDVMRLSIEEGDASGFGGGWRASFAGPMDAEPRFASGRLRAVRVDSRAGGS